MINDALKFITEEVNKYIIRKIDPKLDPTITEWVTLDNIAKAQDAGAGGNTNPLLGKAVLSLVNIEEDKISKSPMNYQKVNDKIEYRNPKIHLNLYCLFSVNLASYETTLKWLSYIVQFFQYRNVFDHINSPKLPSKIDRVVFDLYTMNFEQVNHLWGTLGGKYLPSALYKVRLITIEDDTPDALGEPVVKISVNDNALVN